MRAEALGMQEFTGVNYYTLNRLAKLATTALVNRQGIQELAEQSKKSLAQEPSASKLESRGSNIEALVTDFNYLVNTFNSIPKRRMHEIYPNIATLKRELGDKKLRSMSNYLGSTDPKDAKDFNSVVTEIGAELKRYEDGKGEPLLSFGGRVAKKEYTPEQGLVGVTLQIVGRMAARTFWPKDAAKPDRKREVILLSFPGSESGGTNGPVAQEKGFKTKYAELVMDALLETAEYARMNQVVTMGSILNSAVEMGWFTEGGLFSNALCRQAKDGYYERTGKKIS